MDDNNARSELRKLREENAWLRTTKLELEATVQEKEAAAELLRKKVAELEAEKQWLNHLLFGRRREAVDPSQLLLFPDLTAPEPAPPAHAAEAPDDEADVERPKATRKRRRFFVPPTVARERIEIPLAEEDRTCSYCKVPMMPMGEEVSQELDYRPASFLLKEYVRPKYACRKCKQGVAVALAPERPIDKGRPGPGLLAHVVTCKYGDHLPLNRLEGIFAREGVQISRQTMCDWIAAVHETLQPIVAHMKRSVLGSLVIQSDDTPVLVLDKEARGGSHRSFLWAYLGDQGDVVFDFTRTRSRDGPETFLQGYRGFLQADAYQGYDGLYRSGEIVEVGCWAHARRGLFEAAQKGSEPALHGFALVRMLYRLEAQATEAGLKPDALRDLRQRESRPILSLLKTWLDEQRMAALPKSPLGEAVGYLLNQWTALNRFVDDGRLAIDNNAAERALRAVAVGRKNWEFAGSYEGGKRAATLYSIVGTCKRNGIDPFAYLRDVLLAVKRPGARADRLTPRAWQAAQSPADAPGTTQVESAASSQS